MTAQKHTPGAFPNVYEAREPSSRDRAVERPAIRFDDDTGAVIATITLSGWKSGEHTSRDWASRFVTAHNLHDEMVEALRSVYERDKLENVEDSAIASILAKIDGAK